MKYTRSQIDRLLDTMESLEGTPMAKEVSRLVQRVVKEFCIVTCLIVQSDPNKTPAQPTGFSLAPTEFLSTDEVFAIQEGRKLDAVKMFRNRTGMSLFDSRNLVDKLWDMQ